MVTTVLPATEPTSIWHERCALPSMWMVQAPQRPAPQPYFVPFNPTWSRMAHNSGVLGSASTETCRLFKVDETMLPPLVWRFSRTCTAAIAGWDRGTALLVADLKSSSSSVLATWRVFHMGKIQKCSHADVLWPCSFLKVQCKRSPPI